MSKTRRNVRKGTPSTFRRLAPFTALLGLGVAFALIYVLLDSKIEQHGNELKRLDAQILEAQRTLKAEELDWARTLRPEHLRQALAAHGLDMRWPQPHQRLEIRDHAGWVRSQTARSGNIAALDAAAPGVAQP